MYVAVKGGETAVKQSRRLVAKARRGDESVPEIEVGQIMNQMGLAVDRVMAEGSLYDPLAAATAIRQAQGDLVEAVFLVRAFRTTLPRFGNSKPAATDKMRLFRRISGIFKDIPGGQILGPTYDYTHRLIDFENKETAAGPGAPETASGPISEKFHQIPWVRDLLVKQGLMPEVPDEFIGEPVPDLTRQPLRLPAQREVRLQNMARGDEGFLLASAYSLQRGFGLDRHPFLGELRVGYASLAYTPPELGFEIEIGEVRLTECFMVNRDNGGKDRQAGIENGYGLVFGQNERKAMSMSLLDRSLTRAGEEGAQIQYPAQDQEFILAHSDNVESSGFVQHLKLPHYVDFQSELVLIRNQNKGTRPKKRKRWPPVYNFAYLDEQTKKMIRRAVLKAMAIPGYQVPFGGREMPLPYGWGTGGIQLTASLLGKADTLKVIDQGSDDTVNAVSIKDFFKKTAGIAITEQTVKASIIQTRHRIPETPLKEGQIMVFQVPIPDPLQFIEPRRPEAAKMHAFTEYGAMYVKLYEDIARHGRISLSFDYPVLVNHRYIMSPSPNPKFDNPKLHQSPAIHLFGAGREKRIYAVPPYTDVVSLDFDDYPFELEKWKKACAICGSRTSFLDEILMDDKGTRHFVCSDTEYCRAGKEAS